jgi:hypothetical protein
MSSFSTFAIMILGAIPMASVIADVFTRAPLYL